MVCSRVLDLAKSHLVKKMSSFDIKTQWEAWHLWLDRWQLHNSRWGKRSVVYICVLKKTKQNYADFMATDVKLHQDFSRKVPERLHIFWHPECNRKMNKIQVEMVKQEIMIAELWTFEVWMESVKRKWWLFREKLNCCTSKGWVIDVSVLLQWKALWMLRSGLDFFEFFTV